MTIADKLIPSFYIIDVTGQAVQSILPGEFGIEKIAIASRDFSNDMDAQAALSNAMAFITLNPVLDKTYAEESVNYNPEFFPSLLPLNVENPREVLTQEMQEMVLPNGAVAIPITNAFDILGDFIESRWLIKSPTFKIEGRVAVSPDKYITHKAFEYKLSSGPPLLKSEIKTVHLH